MPPVLKPAQLPVPFNTPHTHYFKWFHMALSSVSLLEAGPQPLNSALPS